MLGGTERWQYLKKASGADGSLRISLKYGAVHPLEEINQ
jgi:hypothetical protein